LETTVGKLKIGAPLVMGRYSVSKDADPAPIVWLKGTPNSDFITEFAVDYLPLDALERESENIRHRYSGNPDYNKSNLLQFLNSDQDEWYSPTHQYDTPPVRSNVNNGYKDTYYEHYGFLYYFEEYEVSCIDGDAGTKIHLPVYGTFHGEDRLQLFRKKGIRAKATEDFVANKGVGFRETSFIPIWLADESEYNDEARIMGRNGEVNYQRPVYSCGVRPICVVKPDTIVVCDDDGLYHIKPCVVSVNVCTDEELFELLGMAQP
jgi:hypothetical protein